MMKNEELMAMVMTDNVTLADWKEFRAYYESLPMCFSAEKLLAGQKPTEEEKQTFERLRNDFVKAAHHVVSKLSEEDICQDVVLLLAYEEIHHPERF